LGDREYTDDYAVRLRQQKRQRQSAPMRQSLRTGFVIE
jgi:hypothetical protein